MAADGLLDSSPDSWQRFRSWPLRPRR
jgi:hypothetical protein